VGGELPFVIAETWARRWGRRSTRPNHEREPLASSPQRLGAASGWRWRVLTLVLMPPWTQRPWGLPVWSVPAPTPAGSQRVGRRPKTGPDRARQLSLLVRRWLPTVELTVLGDPTSSVLELGKACTRRRVYLLAPRRMDAALEAPTPLCLPGPYGRPRVKGERWP
jgi:hypothetical protein